MKRWDYGFLLYTWLNFDLVWAIALLVAGLTVMFL
jgi:hypothetical protein